MYGKTDEELIIRFLERNYPVARVKHDNKFRRGIIMDGGITFVLGDSKSYLEMRRRLIYVLQQVFTCDDNLIKATLHNFLPTRTKTLE